MSEEPPVPGLCHAIRFIDQTGEHATQMDYERHGIGREGSCALIDTLGRAMELFNDTKLISVTWAVVSRAVAKAFRSGAFPIAVEQALRENETELHMFHDVSTCKLVISVVTVPVAKFVEPPIEEGSREKVEMESDFIKVHEAVDQRKDKTEDGFG